jgi:hypothetical protein
MPDEPTYRKRRSYVWDGARFVEREPEERVGYDDVVAAQARLEDEERRRRIASVVRSGEGRKEG